MWSLGDSTLEQVTELYLSLRPEDLEELETLTLKDGLVALNELVVMTEAHGRVFSITDEAGSTLGLLGVIPKPEQSNLWLLTSEETDANPREVVKSGRKIIEEVCNWIGPVYSIINNKNKRTQTLCRALGFVKGEGIDNYKGSGLSFIYMHRS